MQSVPQPSAEDTLANTSFAALLGALSRPGQIHRLPEAGTPPVIAALLDRECRVYAVDGEVRDQIRATGAHLTEPQDADHLFLGTPVDLAVFNLVNMGSDLYPDQGATVVVDATFTEGQALRLSGPGIETSMTVEIGGLPNGFWQMRHDLIRYPMGFDLFLLDGCDVMGLPRSTKIEVL